MPRPRAQTYFDYIAANVTRARMRAGLTQEKLAEAADIDLRFLQRIERGRTNLSVAILVALADALGVAPGSLLRRSALPAPRRGRPPGTKRGTR